MKKKVIMLTLSVMLILSGCGQETTASAEAPEKKESVSASGATTLQKESEKATRTEATPEPTQKPEDVKEVAATEKPTATATSTATPEPASTKAPETQNTTGSSTSSRTGSSASGSATVNATEAPKAETTKAPVEQSTPAPTEVPTTAPTAVPHEHSWDGGSVTTAASCGSEGTKTYSCSCGATTTESIPTTEHNWVVEVYGEATCTGAAYAYNKCSICDKTGDGWRVDPLGHDVESYEKHGGDCNTPAQIGNTCRRCGDELGDTYGGVNPSVHTWETLTSEVFNEETFKWETVTGTQCSGCGAIQ